MIVLILLCSDRGRIEDRHGSMFSRDKYLAQIFNDFSSILKNYTFSFKTMVSAFWATSSATRYGEISPL